MKKREGTKLIIFEPAKTRLANNQCPACGKPKSKWKRRKDWRCCSVECTNKYHTMYYTWGWPDLRLKIFRRDNFTCVKCGKRPVTIKPRFDSENDEDFKWRAEQYDRDLFVKYVEKGYEIFDTSELVGDHIIPIAIGGSEWDLDNIQTLCKECHKKKTAKDLKKIATIRKEKNKSDKQQYLNMVKILLF